MDSCCAAGSSSRTVLPVASLGKRASTLLLAVAIALLPKCPACWSAYAGLGSLLGLSFVVDVRYLLPLTAASLAVAVVALFLMARRGRGYLPFVSGCLASCGVLIGKFMIDSEPLVYLSLLGLVLASLYAGWLGVVKKRRPLAPAALENNPI